MSDKIFQEWEEVNCNECGRYWDSSCDGSDKKKVCNSYVATRSIVIPAKLKKLEEDLYNCRVTAVISRILLIAYILFHSIGAC